MSDDDDTTLSSAESQTPGDVGAPLLHKLGVIARHLIPAIGVLQLGTPVGQFALLTQVNIAFSIGCISVFDADIARRKELSAMTRREQFEDFARALRRCLWYTAAIAALFSIPAMLVYRWSLLTPALFVAVAMMIASAVPGLFEKYRAEIRSESGVAEREKRSIPENQSLLVCAVLLAFYLPYGDPDADGAIVVATTALLIFRELNPGLLMKLLKSGARRG